MRSSQHWPRNRVHPESGSSAAKRDLCRIRVGDYRIIYAIDDRAQAVNVIRIRHRSKAYD
ncbi:MAG TPA: type II toxin-antitoxin system RelE/ParE family toxin [Thermoanaerobaculia bacterium]|nr:type II toxin-antitoxin system RelE/ParE family toxin [Thermoanaerobaculia bacterium]